METRAITEVKIYVLIMNNMRGQYEDTVIVAVSDGPNKLRNFIDSERVEKYRDEDDLNMVGFPLTKTFRKGGPLEYFNAPYISEDIRPIDSIRPGDTGIFYEWVNIESLPNIRDRHRFL